MNKSEIQEIFNKFLSIDHDLFSEQTFRTLVLMQFQS